MVWPPLERVREVTNRPWKFGPPSGGHGDSAPAGGFVQGMHPHFLFQLAEKKTGRARSKRKGRLDALRCSGPPRATGVGVSVPALIWTGLRARYALLRFLLLPSRGGWRRPRRGGCRMELLLFSLLLTLPRRIRQRVAQRNARKEKQTKCVLAPLLTFTPAPRESAFKPVPHPAAPVGRSSQTRRHHLSSTPVQQLCTDVQSCDQSVFSLTPGGARSLLALTKENGAHPPGVWKWPRGPPSPP